MLLELASEGAQVRLGLNFLGQSALREELRAIRQFDIFEPEVILSREDHWSRLLEGASNEFIRYIFAGDSISKSLLRKHVRELETSNAGLVFSSRRASVGIIPIPFQALQRFVWWGLKSRRVNHDEFVNSCISTGSNLLGEPSFVTFRKSLGVSWVDGFGFAVELALYEKLLKKSDAIWIPGIAGTFGVTAGSSSEELSKRQSSDYARWLESIGLPENLVAEGKKQSLRKQKLRVRLYTVVSRLKGFR